MTVEDAILELVAAAPTGKSIAPEDAARAVGGDAWRSRLSEVRRVAVRLAQEGRIVITRKGKPADPATFKGVYRLRRPIDGEGASAEQV